MSSLKDKNIIVTGASGGIGNSIVERLNQNGANILATGTRIEKLEELKEKFNNIKILKFDISQHDKIEEFIENATKELGGSLDCIINNAGITGSTSSLWDYDVVEWNKIIEINLMGTFNCCKCVVPYMIKNDYGRIVNVASVAGKDGNANASAYSSAKAGVIGLTKSLGKELADKNIAVNAVTPAGAKTRILDQMSKEHVARMLSKVPRGRFLEIEEFTSLICWLASEENSFSTAAVFDISGGRSTY